MISRVLFGLVLEYLGKCLGVALECILECGALSYQRFTVATQMAFGVTGMASDNFVKPRECVRASDEIAGDPLEEPSVEPLEIPGGCARWRERRDRRVPGEFCSSCYPIPVASSATATRPAIPTTVEVSAIPKFSSRTRIFSALRTALVSDPKSSTRANMREMSVNRSPK